MSIFLGKHSRRGFVTLIISAFGALIGWASIARAQSKDTVDPTRHRRVVTGFDSSGKSTITWDGHVPKASEYKMPGWAFSELWVSKVIPANLSDSSDPLVEWKFMGFEPPDGGFVTRICTFEPGFEARMHTTSSIDFGIVVTGALELKLENGSTVARPGDVIVQRGTPHGWRTVGNEPCTAVFILIDAAKS